MTNAGAVTIGVVLAGGKAHRIGGGDKPMRMVGGRTILDRVLDRMKPQCDGMVLSANGDPARFSSFGLPIVADDAESDLGPLAGVLSALDWTAANRPTVDWVVSVAGDCPFLPRDLVRRLHQHRVAEKARLAVAMSGGRRHPVIALWPVALRHDLRRALVTEGVRKVDMWTARYPIVAVVWPAEPVDPFFNVNTAEHLATAERLAERPED